MRISWIIIVAVMIFQSLQGAVPELESRVPSATGYEIICKLNPQNYNTKGCIIDNSETFLGDINRIGYLLILTDRSGKENWVFTSMDPFTKNIYDLAMPTDKSPIFQTYVTNLEVASNVPSIKTGKFTKGNVEIWGKNYSRFNAKKIPSATSNLFDWGDYVMKTGSYGSLQVHNYLEKQTVFAFNKFAGGMKSDLGIGNNVGKNPDWSFSASARNYKSSTLYIVAKINNMTINESVGINPATAKLIGKTDKSPLSYMPNEEITFTLSLKNQKKEATRKYFVRWTRRGDDGKSFSKTEPITVSKPVVIKTSLDRPGFVRILAHVVDDRGRKTGNIFFDGGAAVQPELLKAIDEPKDFDEFWKKQRAKLDTVPVKAEVKKVQDGQNVTLYKVKIACYGPRPVTGYLTVPKNAKAKSLPARVTYIGYGFYGNSDTGRLNENIKTLALVINAHGYDLGRDKEYYDKFAEGIKSNGYGYALDPKQNSNPETAYFNGMAMRVMRSLDYIKTRPEWDGKILTVNGISQGGLQTIWAAMLDKDISYAYPGIPWCCDLGGNTKFKERQTAPWRIKYVKTLDYYDPIFCASRIKCPVYITRGGLGDYSCPPSGVAIFYNELKSPKKISWYQGSTHGYVPPEAYQEIIVKESK